MPCAASRRAWRPNSMCRFGRLAEYPFAAHPFVALRVPGLEVVAIPGVNGDRCTALGDVDHVEALLLLTNSRRGSCSRLDDEHAAGARHQVASILADGVMRVARQEHVDP